VEVAPRFVTIEMPCTNFSPITTWNPAFAGTEGQRKLQERRKRDQPFLELVEFVFRIQLQRGNHAFFENPRFSQVWSTPQVRNVLGMNKVRRVNCDMCEHGARHIITGNPVKKPTTLLVTHPEFEKNRPELQRPRTRPSRRESDPRHGYIFAVVRAACCESSLEGSSRTTFM
jgi:hypothetical protein